MEEVFVDSWWRYVLIGAKEAWMLVGLLGEWEMGNG